MRRVELIAIPSGVEFYVVLCVVACVRAVLFGRGARAGIVIDLPASGAVIYLTQCAGSVLVLVFSICVSLY
jgi:hypothetical protein